MTPEAFTLVAPLEQRVRYALLLAILHSPVTLREAAERDGSSVSQLGQWLFHGGSPTVSRYAHWCAAFDLRPRFDFIAKEDLASPTPSAVEPT